MKESKVALKLACEHLASVDPFVACFQEVPAKVTVKQLLNWSSGHLRVLHPLADRRIVLACSASITPASEGVSVLAPSFVTYGAERMMGVSLHHGTFGAFQTIGVHFPNRLHLPPGHQRSRVVGALADQMRLFWDEGPLIVLGDFNENPFSPEMASRSGLWALRDRQELTQERDLRPRDAGLPFSYSGTQYSSSMELDALRAFRRMRPLYNPMWRHLVERSKHPHGTYYRQGDDAIISWSCLDQILVSQHLAERIGDLRILDSVKNTPLFKSNRKTIDPAYGDHLPVELAFS